MKKLFFLILIAAAAWYGWKNYPTLFTRQPSHEAVIQNDGSAALERVRLTVDGQTLVKESLPSGEKAVFPFRVNNDASFVLAFQWANRVGEREWKGGMVPKGPMLQRHFFNIDDNGEVMYRAENK